ncbi:hypothetical protein DB347_24250 [Opitutaceae bacterium EW11]|nr:hypothetical protein DB347_24250 [Opitutaceae bacterium EW11]
MLKEFLTVTLPTAVAIISGVQGPTPTTPTPSLPSTPPASGSTIFRGNGTIDPAAYLRYVTASDKESISARLGPTFESLNLEVADTRPTNFKPASHECLLSWANRTNPYELGSAGCSPDGDYWSDSGQVAYVPDNAATDPGLDRIQTFAYYDNVFALSPRLDFASGRPHPDPQTDDPNYVSILGHPASQPIAMVRNYGMLQNEALVLYKGGLLGVAGTQTSREGYERPYPGLLFPANKVPTGIAVTSANEFALITIWDTQTQRGQLAVVALEGKYLPFHTWPYMALPNQGSWSDFKLLGYVDLPMAAPSAVAAASNGWWNGPSQTANEVLSQINLADPGVRWGLTSGEYGWSSIVASKGYAIVASKLDNKAVIVDLTPLFGYVRSSYLSSDASFKTTTSTRGDGAGQWPATFTENPQIAPRVVWERSLPAPTAVLAGLRIDRWSPDRHKAYIAQEDGTIHIIDTSSLMARWDWEKNGVLSELGTVKVGRNPVNMAFTRFLEYPLPLIPNGSDGQPRQADPLNNTFYVACRGDREVDAVVTYEGKGQVYRRISDTRMGDPVAVSVASRGYIVTVADFNGRKVISFRVGALSDRHGRWYGCGADGKAGYECTGELSFSGYPIAVNSVNVN